MMIKMFDNKKNTYGQINLSITRKLDVNIGYLFIAKH